MQIESLLIEYLNLRLQKVLFVRRQNFQMAAEVRDKERQKSKEICNILNPGGEWVSWNNCDNMIDDYCKQVHNCSTYDYSLCIKAIERVRKLNDLGI